MTKQLLRELQSAASSGGAVLVTVVERNGSAPRGAGASMIVYPDGRMTGTIGGGSLEYRARQHATERTPDAPDETKTYEIHPGHTERANAASGTVRVLFRRFCGDRARQLLDQALRAIENEDGAFLICPLENEAAGETELVSSDCLMERFSLDRLPEASVLRANETYWFVEPLLDDPRVLLFGGGHVAQKTAAQLALLDYRVWVIEARAEFADPALFPDAERILCATLEEVQKSLAIGAHDHAMVMTSAHESDYRILRWLLTTPADYIGCIGSRQKIARAKEKLLLDGVTLTQLGRIHAPIGLDIGAETPAEIAVSIAAELIAYSRKRDMV